MYDMVAWEKNSDREQYGIADHEKLLTSGLHLMTPIRGIHRHATGYSNVSD